MSVKGQVALAVGAGYLLGRTHKMKAALMLAAAGATGKYRGGPRDLLQRGARALADSPEVARLGESIRSELMNAAKAAAVTAASDRIDSLNNRLQGGVADTVDGVGDVVRKATNGAAEDDADDYVDEEPEDEFVEEDAADEDATEEDATEEDATEEDAGDDREQRRPAARRRASGGTRDTESAEGNGSTRRKTRASTQTRSAPVRRTRK